MTENELKAIVQTNIRRYRDYRKWTQAQLAEKVEISINFLSDIENGKKWISAATMVKIASTFNIEPFELFRTADAPEASVSALFSRYNKEVIQVVSDSLERTYRYYQVLADEKPLAKDTKNPEAGGGDIYRIQNTKRHSSAADSNSEK